jgi:small redox-active disulfide protein 2
MAINYNLIIYKTMEIKILGTGCAKCKTAQAVVEKVVSENGVDATITKVEDIVEIMKYNVMFTPAIVVDEVVKIKGRVPSEKEVKQVLGIQ